MTEYFVKPAKNGSSIGVSRVTNLNDLESAVNDAKKFSDQVILKSAMVMLNTQLQFSMVSL